MPACSRAGKEIRGIYHTDTRQVFNHVTRADSTTLWDRCCVATFLLGNKLLLVFVPSMTWFISQPETKASEA